VQESTEVRREYIGIRVQMLGQALGGKMTDEKIRVFKDALERFPTRVMSVAFTRAEQQLERFPTPKLMQTICGECMPSNSWMYDYKKRESRDPETGRTITVAIDPVTGDQLFRPQDCPEGRAFLNKFRELAGKPLLGADGKHTAQCLCGLCRGRREAQP